MKIHLSKALVLSSLLLTSCEASEARSETSAIWPDGGGSRTGQLVDAAARPISSSGGSSTVGNTGTSDPEDTGTAAMPGACDCSSVDCTQDFCARSADGGCPTFERALREAQSAYCVSAYVAAVLKTEACGYLGLVVRQQYGMKTTWFDGATGQPVGERSSDEVLGDTCRGFAPDATCAASTCSLCEGRSSEPLCDEARRLPDAWP